MFVHAPPSVRPYAYNPTRWISIKIKMYIKGNINFTLITDINYVNVPNVLVHLTSHLKVIQSNTSQKNLSCNMLCQFYFVFFKLLVFNKTYIYGTDIYICKWRTSDVFGFIIWLPLFSYWFWLPRITDTGPFFPFCETMIWTFMLCLHSQCGSFQSHILLWT
jgi:hypothetical protein